MRQNEKNGHKNRPCKWALRLHLQYARIVMWSKSILSTAVILNILNKVIPSLWLSVVILLSLLNWLLLKLTFVKYSLTRTTVPSEICVVLSDTFGKLFRSCLAQQLRAIGQFELWRFTCSWITAGIQQGHFWRTSWDGFSSWIFANSSERNSKQIQWNLY